MDRTEDRLTGPSARARRWTAWGLPVAVALTTLAGAASAAADSLDRPHRGLPRLTGTVGPDFDISIDQASVPAGRYKLVVRDRGTITTSRSSGKA